MIKEYYLDKIINSACDCVDICFQNGIEIENKKNINTKL